MSLSVGQTARFRLDDTDNPGWAKVRILKQVKGVVGLPTYEVEVLEVIKPSCARTPRRGSKLTVAARDFGGQTRLFADEGVVTGQHGN